MTRQPGVRDLSPLRGMHGRVGPLDESVGADRAAARTGNADAHLELQGDPGETDGLVRRAGDAIDGPIAGRFGTSWRTWPRGAGRRRQRPHRR